MRTLAGQVLEAWRRAERLAKELEPGTRDHEAALEACERLRDLYHDVFGDLAGSGLVDEATAEDAHVLLRELAE